MGHNHIINIVWLCITNLELIRHKQKVEDKNMYCPKCGNLLEDGMKYCALCGADLNAIEQTDPIADYSESTTPETDTYYSETEYTTPNEDDYSGVATATLPKSEENPATSHEPEPEPELTPAPERPENKTVTTHTKKNKAIKPIIIAACVVAVLSVGGYICKANFTPAVSRLIKGDQGYAISLAERSAMEFINNADPLTNLTSNVIPSLYATSNDNTYIENAITANMFANVVMSAIGEDNITVSHNISVTTLSDYNNLTEGIDTRYKDLIKSLGNYTLYASVSSNDDNKTIYGSLSYNDTDILSAGLSYPNNGKDSYITLPAVTDQFVTLTLPRQATNAGIDADELNLYSSMLDVIKYYYKDAEITYSKGKENVGDISFNGDIVTVSFNQQTISNILGDMADVISDSNLRGSLGNNSVLSQFIQFLENEQDYIYFMSDTNCYLDFTTFVNNDGSIAGNKIKYRENHRNDKKSFDFLSLSEGSKYAVYAKINGVKMVDVRVDRQSNTSGNAVVSLALSDNDTVVLVVDYKDFEIKKLHNLPVLTGSYTITPYLSDNLIYALSEVGLNTDTLYTLETNPTTLNLSAEDNSYKVDLTLANIAQITAETKLSEDIATVRKVGEEINSNDIVSIEDLDTKISEYVAALNDPLFAIINNTSSDPETSDAESYEETEPETSESYYGY